MGVGRVETDHSHVELRDPVELGRGEGEAKVETQRLLQLLVTFQQLLSVGDGTASELTFPCRLLNSRLVLKTLVHSYLLYHDFDDTRYYLLP